MTTHTKKHERFNALHVAGTPLVLYNIWDAGGARTLVEAGAEALATGSWSVAAAHGFDDGEAIPLAFALDIVARIAASVAVPLTVDFESGYAREPDAITANVRRMLRAGAVGVNFEDQVIGGNGVYAVDEQCQRIGAVRRAAELEGLPLFINARTDLFLQANGEDHAGLIDAAIERGNAYRSAGADGFFVPGLAQPALIARVCEAVSLPVNAMKLGEQPALSELAAAGVARVSCGPGAYRSAQEDLAARYRALT
ncbi:MAG: isocitrate lyase/phosphoenolpyruvate mutase family protein [Pseudomonadota bacterium]